MTPGILRVVVAAAIALLLFAAGWAVEGWRKDGQIARIERAHAEQRAHDAEAASAALAESVARGDALAARVAAAETAREIAHQEKADALRKVTTGRPCLGGAAVRLLNDSPGIRPVPAPAGQPALADAAAASDTDVAQWAATAIRHYDTCRGRLDAVAEFFAEPAK